MTTGSPSGHGPGAVDPAPRRWRGHGRRGDGRRADGARRVGQGPDAVTGAGAGAGSETPTVTIERRGLSRGLRARHIHFIALGSAIGTGLFYGSADAIKSAGPAVLLVYLLCGAVVYFMLRALGEMAVHSPVSGSFAEYAGRHLGPGAGFLTGWMYAFEMLIVCIADLTAIAIYMGFWFPDTAQWVWVAAAVLIVGGVNLASSRVFGELEFGLTLVKVSAVVAMIGGGIVLIVLGVGDAGSQAGLHNLVDHGGFLPNGLEGMALALVVAMFAFGGAEIIGVTAGEADDPARTIPEAVNTVPVRILVFYVLTILVILTLNPWTEITGEESPFVEIFSNLGIGWAAAALNVVVISAALSAINSDIFGAARILYGMAERGVAPRAFLRTSARGVPVVTTVGMILVTILGVVLNYLVPESLFLIVASLATFATVFVWLMILVSHLVGRHRMDPQEAAALEFPVPLWPWGQYFALAVIALTFVMMLFTADTRVALVVGVVFTLATVVIWQVLSRTGRLVARPHDQG